MTGATVLAWLNFDHRRWLIPIAIGLTIWAAYAAFWSFVDAHADAAVDRARKDWIEDARKAQSEAEQRAADSLEQSAASNNKTRKELSDAARKGDDSPVGAGVNGVLDSLQSPAATNR